MTVPPPDTSSMFKTPEGHRRCMALYDRMLTQITVPYEAQFVETRFGATHVMPFVPFEKRAGMFLQVMGAPGYEPTAEDKELFGLLLTDVKHDGRAPDALPDEVPG